MSELIPLFAVQGMRLVRELRRPEAKVLEMRRKREGILYESYYSSCVCMEAREI